MRAVGWPPGHRNIVRIGRFCTKGSENRYQGPRGLQCVTRKNKHLNHCPHSVICLKRSSLRPLTRLVWGNRNGKFGILGIVRRQYNTALLRVCGGISFTGYGVLIQLKKTNCKLETEQCFFDTGLDWRVLLIWDYPLYSS